MSGVCRLEATQGRKGPWWKGAPACGAPTFGSRKGWNGGKVIGVSVLQGGCRRTGSDGKVGRGVLLAEQELARLEAARDFLAHGHGHVPVL